MYLFFPDLLTIDDNFLTGDISPMFCEGENLSRELEILYADCGGDDPEVLCSCCTLCCDAEGTTCNDDELLANFDPIWEVMYNRQFWFFNDTDPLLVFQQQFNRQ